LSDHTEFTKTKDHGTTQQLYVGLAQRKQDYADSEAVDASTPFYIYRLVRSVLQFSRIELARRTTLSVLQEMLDVTLRRATRSGEPEIHPPYLGDAE
jgi:hypothetical protein